MRQLKNVVAIDFDGPEIGFVWLERLESGYFSVVDSHLFLVPVTQSDTGRQNSNGIPADWHRTGKFNYLTAHEFVLEFRAKLLPRMARPDITIIVNGPADLPKLSRRLFLKKRDITQMNFAVINLHPWDVRSTKPYHLTAREYRQNNWLNLCDQTIHSQFQPDPSDKNFTYKRDHGPHCAVYDALECAFYLNQMWGSKGEQMYHLIDFNCPKPEPTKFPFSAKR